MNTNKNYEYTLQKSNIDTKNCHVWRELPFPKHHVGYQGCRLWLTTYKPTSPEASYDRMMVALSQKLPEIPMITLWPGGDRVLLCPGPISNTVKRIARAIIWYQIIDIIGYDVCRRYMGILWYLQVFLFVVPVSLQINKSEGRPSVFREESWHPRHPATQTMMDTNLVDSMEYMHRNGSRSDFPQVGMMFLYLS